MESEKLEDLLLLSLSASKGQRERSEVLDVGVTRTKTCGGHRQIQWGHRRTADTRNGDTKASGGLCNCKASGGSDRSARGCPEIEYVEMPKNLQTGLYEAKRVSCIFAASFAGR